MDTARSDPRTGTTSSRRGGRDDERWAGISAPTAAEQVVRLRGSVVPECTLARLGAERLWQLLTRAAAT